MLAYIVIPCLTFFICRESTLDSMSMNTTLRDNAVGNSLTRLRFSPAGGRLAR